MQRLEVSGAVRLIYSSLGIKGLMWMDRRTDVTELIVTFYNFAKASKKIEHYVYRK